MTTTPFAPDIELWLDSLGDEDRRELIERLTTPLRDPPDRDHLRRRRRRMLLLLMVSCAVLVPWIVVLAIRLPWNYQAVHWGPTWVGFDTILLVMLASTWLLGWRRRQITLLAAFGSGVLLVCDAWFDVLTADHDHLPYSVAFAVLIELPLAAVLMRSAWLMLLHSTRYLNPSAPRSLWRAQLPMDFHSPRG